MMRKAIFFDRDGVLNRAVVREGKPYPPANLAEMEIMPEARAARALLDATDFVLLCITNQPDVARGSADSGVVNAMNDHIVSQLRLDRLYTCPHDDKDGCTCRKPKPGLLLQAAQDFGLDLARSFMVGDRWRDIEAGAAAGCKTVFVQRHYSEKQPESPDQEVDSTLAAVQWILGQTTPDRP